MLTGDDLEALIRFRHELHRRPEVSRVEAETARRILSALNALAPDVVITGLGGHGIAAVFNGAGPGPTTMFRAELDALPITEVSDAPHRSATLGTAHLCGHDGHMTILTGLGLSLSRQRSARGRVVLLFQPAEEDGSGAAAVIADPRFDGLRPDWAFALHNMPGIAKGACWLAEGPMSCASVGLKIDLFGKTSHASQPERGVSPGLALARLIPALGALGRGGAMGPEFRLVTVTHARLGGPAFGIAPGHGEVWATLRTMLDAAMADLKAEASALVQSEARDGLTVQISHHDDFAAGANHPQAVAQIGQALDAMGIDHEPGELPMRPSEDFGRFGQCAGTKAAMVLLGAGAAHPALHNPDYDFPDDLIAVGADIFDRIARTLNG